MKIKKSHPYYVNDCREVRNHYDAQTKESIYDENGLKLKLVNESVENTMIPKTWYLLTAAYSLTLKKSYLSQKTVSYVF